MWIQARKRHDVEYREIFGEMTGDEDEFERVAHRPQHGLNQANVKCLLVDEVIVIEA